MQIFNKLSDILQIKIINKRKILNKTTDEKLKLPH